jgi:hypothetical protein
MRRFCVCVCVWWRWLSGCAFFVCCGSECGGKIARGEAQKRGGGLDPSLRRTRPPGYFVAEEKISQRLARQGGGLVLPMVGSSPRQFGPIAPSPEKKSPNASNPFLSPSPVMGVADDKKRGENRTIAVVGGSRTPASNSRCRPKSARPAKAAATRGTRPHSSHPPRRLNKSSARDNSGSQNRTNPNRSWSENPESNSSRLWASNPNTSVGSSRRVCGSDSNKSNKTRPRTSQVNGRPTSQRAFHLDSNTSSSYGSGSGSCSSRPTSAPPVWTPVKHSGRQCNSVNRRLREGLISCEYRIDQRKHIGQAWSSLAGAESALSRSFHQDQREKLLIDRDTRDARRKTAKNVCSISFIYIQECA